MRLCKCLPPFLLLPHLLAVAERLCAVGAGVPTLSWCDQLPKGDAAAAAALLPPALLPPDEVGAAGGWSQSPKGVRERGTSRCCVTVLLLRSSQSPKGVRDRLEQWGK